ncbi:MAG: DegT/DnrJ/EryC1/StrS family aminotransferase [Saprospiraceae bacterium]|nr:DegT/DnrJ/EryC1/StrS family aminotransferase [Saprospiraceae bacterium]MCB9322710.1 DegT/DnrJ/EryC1/StrS family aminotransferase [Lewinellaceae bacterium]
MENIQMVDVKGQYQKIKSAVDQAVLDVIESGAFINGPAVNAFQQHLEEYLGAKYVIPCANGTDALQIALMSLGLEPGDEVIVPAFTYVATAEVIALLRLIPVMVDVDPGTFNVTAEIIEKAITPKTKAIVPVHLFGQSCDMEPIMEVANRHHLYVVEDNAQAIGADYTFSNGTRSKTGTIGHIGCTSFYPSKNLGAFGDGGALYTNDEGLAKKCRMIANHGQVRRYYHDEIGVNSRLDTIQAAILDIKLSHLDEYARARQSAAAYYDKAFADVDGLQIPVRQPNSSHVFHQYTLLVKNGKREVLQEYLSAHGVPSMIYYPVPLYAQEAYRGEFSGGVEFLEVTDQLCKEVLSLPIHTEMTEEIQNYIIKAVLSFFN